MICGLLWFGGGGWCCRFFFFARFCGVSVVVVVMALVGSSCSVVLWVCSSCFKICVNGERDKCHLLILYFCSIFCFGRRKT